MDSLKDQRIAILLTKGFEQVELTEPKKALEQAGARADIVSPETGTVKAWNSEDWGDEFTVDEPLDRASADHYNALLLPGGLMNSDKLRRNETALNFVRRFFAAGKPVAAICHAPWILIDAGVVKRRRMTCYPSLQMDLKNAGAYWMDQEVVCDAGLVTSRRPADLPAFNRKMIEEFMEGIHGGQMREFQERIHVPQG